MKKHYKQQARRKFNRLCPDHLGPDQAVVMRFTPETGDIMSFNVHRVLERRLCGSGASEIRRLVIQELD